MIYKPRRRPRRSRAAECSWEGHRQGRENTSSLRIVAHLTCIRHRLARFIAPDLIWNPDMSLEIDRLLTENERLQARITEIAQQLGEAAE